MAQTSLLTTERKEVHTPTVLYMLCRNGEQVITLQIASLYSTEKATCCVNRQKMVYGLNSPLNGSIHGQKVG